ncbi:hypothetical protein R3P38DRAFT_3282345 [Favolaschia claudopus]|uniref:Uncharacterized protein n=1 Tax=Favolaschia claudopus TaxID=2862362 RepID=A0AAW0ADL3_9AGAR
MSLLVRQLCPHLFNRKPEPNHKQRRMAMMAKSISQGSQRSAESGAGSDRSIVIIGHGQQLSIPDIHDMSSIPSEGRTIPSRERPLCLVSILLFDRAAPPSPSLVCITKPHLPPRRKLASSGILPSRAVDSVEQLESRLTAQERGLVGVKIEVTALKGDVAELKEDVVGLKVDVVGLKEDVVGLKEDVVGLKHDIATMRDEIMSMLTALVKK